jgi:glycosyltransferase involved in cell wall biosynthesis
VARICVVRQFEFPQDVRVHREVSALLAAGHEVDVVCVAAPGAPRRERDGRLRIVRLPLRHRRGSALTYLLTYAAFLVLATVVVALLHIRRRYRLVQVNTVPDTLVFSAAVPKLTGARVLLDLHESMPEFYATKFGVGLEHWAVRTVAILEQASVRFADAAITCTEQQRQAFASRGADPSRIDVVLNASDEAIFDPRRFPRAHPDGQFVVLCHGTIERHYGLDTLVRAAALVRGDIPGLRVEVFGDGTYRPELRRLVAELDLEDVVWLSDGFVPRDELVAAIARADVGVVAMKRDAFRDLTHCNKMFDFIAMHVPAAVSRTHAVEAYFDERCFRYFTAGDELALAAALRDLHRVPGLRERLAARAAEVAEPYRWPRQRELYLAAVDAQLRAGRR